MLTSIWRAAADTRLTFWSLAASSALFFIGALYGNANFELFNGLNETRIQDWMAANLRANIDLVWWLPLLLVALLVLGVNTFACTVQRVASLVRVRKQQPVSGFVRELTPSIIHGLFAVVMIGHLVTITMGEWRRLPLEQGARIELPGIGTTLTIESIEDEMFPPVDGQPPRIAQTRVVLTSSDGGRFELGHGDPLSYEGRHLILDRQKKRKDKRQKKDENCNREKDYRLDDKAPPMGPTLLIVNDPGIVLIFPAFVVILILMGWYYAGRGSERRAK